MRLTKTYDVHAIAALPGVDTSYISIYRWMRTLGHLPVGRVPRKGVSGRLRSLYSAAQVADALRHFRPELKVAA